MHISLLLSHLPTACALAFAGWASYEATRYNRIAVKHSQSINAQHQREEAVKAIVRFDDEIMPDIRSLLHDTSDTLSMHDYLLAITVILKIDRWSVFVSSGIADNKLIKSRVRNTIRNVAVKYERITRRIADSGLYNINGYIDLLRKFSII